MPSSFSSSIAVLGAGSWGTALALYLAKQEQSVRLWTHRNEHAAAMQHDHANKDFLPNYPFPANLKPTGELEFALKDCEDILIAVPSVGFRTTLQAIKPLISSNTRIVWATKGLDLVTGQLLHEIALEILGSNRSYAVLSGPSFASEVAAGLPTAVVIASSELTFAENLHKRFNSPTFRVYISSDITGVEVGGVVKNVLAIATGICDGMKLGANARSALITRGLAEMTRLGLAVGGHYETFMGLAGLGDLVLTATDNQSRNRRFGLALGSGKSVHEATQAIGQVIEGKRNAELVVQLAKQHNVEMPISETVLAVLQEQLDLSTAVKTLLSRATGME